jgi:cyclopropane-fatty-acyl-phospholipid synthase
MPSSILIASSTTVLEAPHRTRLTAIERAAKGRLVDAFARLRSGAVALHDASGERVLGNPKGPLGTIPLEVLSPSFWTAIAFGGDVGAGEAFVAGQWRTTDLVGLLRLFTRDRDVLLAIDGSWSSLPTRLVRSLGHWLRDNTRAGSKQNIHDHYDLGDELFAQFLDPTMTYSSAYYAHDGQSLEDAQREKLRRLCRMVDLREGDRMLEIGTGWGSLAMTAAGEFGAQVTTTTISENQFRRAGERVAAAGLQDRVTLLKRDYRDLDGTFDKLLSCEMIEAVGAKHLPTYLKTCASLLRKGGVLGLQAITINDRFYDSALRCVDYIKKHVFPGSFIPSVTAIADAATKHTDLRMEFCEDFGPHYATTIAEWRRRLLDDATPFVQRDPSGAMVRAWDYYFAYCEAGFRERHIGVCHLRFARS